MKRWSGVLNLAQAGIYAALAVYLGERWLPAGGLLGLAAAAQLGAAVGLLWKQDLRGVKWAGWLGVLVTALIAGLHVQVSVHIIQTFTPVGGETGWATLGALLVLLPWGLLIPVVQLIQLGGTRLDLGAGSATLLALIVPPLLTLGTLSRQVEFAPVEGDRVAGWMFDRWSGLAHGAAWVDPPTGPGPVAIVATVIADGALVETRTYEGETLEEALVRFRLVNQYKPGQALYIDFAETEQELYEPLMLASDGPALARPGQTGLRYEHGIHSTFVSWRGEAVGRRTVAPGFLSVPAIRRGAIGGGTHQVRMESWLASDLGVAPVVSTWTAPPELTADSALDAALQGALYIAKNQQDDGRYAYIIEGPTGELGRGYNFPRHAGATWYLARVYNATGDERVLEAAERGLQYLVANSKKTQDGRAHIHDPKRSDGKAWVGTTALALAGFTELDAHPEWQQAYADFIASAVDQRGSVRGDMDVATGLFPEQDEVTYAQGQGLLALALAERAGLDGVSEPLDRAIAYVEGDYWPMPASNFTMLDEHWMCLASVAVHSQRGQAAGLDICTAYLADVKDRDPVDGSGLQPSAGPGAGLAEAVIARAELDRRMGRAGPYRERSLSYGRLMMANLYQPGDRPLLGNDALIGGFRDRPWDLDVQVDAVQHIGCALLGVEQLLRDQELPGRMP
jgi:hypothetical protein